MAAPAPGKDLAAMTIARIVRSGWKNYAVWMRPERNTRFGMGFEKGEASASSFFVRLLPGGTKKSKIPSRMGKVDS